MGNAASATAASSLPPLQTAPSCVTDQFMGTWFVIAVKPTPFETHNSNAVEQYSLSTKKHHDIDISFTYNSLEDPYGAHSALKKTPQKAWVVGENKQDSAEWKISPIWPLKLPYLILDVDPVDYQYTVIGYPSRAYCWIMYRHPVMPDALYQELITKLETVHHYDLTNLRRVPQLWTDAERTKRGLTEREIPDEQLLVAVDSPADTDTTQ